MSGLSGDSGSSGQVGFSDMLALMANPQALQAKYADFEAKRKAAEAAIALVGPAKDVLRFREQAARDADEAKQTLADARQQANKMLSDASGNAAQVSQVAQDKAAQIITDAEREKGVAAARLAEVTQAKAEQVTQQAQLDVAAKAITLRALNVTAREDGVFKREAVADEREKNIVAVRDLVVAQFAEHAKTLKKV